MENLEVINFKKRNMSFENNNTRVISPLDPIEGQLYAETINDKVVGGWDHTYNLFEDYINPSPHGELGWCRTSSTSSNFEETLKNW